ncbi:MAG: hypothetical protein J1F66_05090, partial [Clostridiales bacterium]|nr:hypothetical protein [Clostridiales bacterium]
MKRSETLGYQDEHPRRPSFCFFYPICIEKWGDNNNLWSIWVEFLRIFKFFIDFCFCKTYTYRATTS